MKFAEQKSEQVIIGRPIRIGIFLIVLLYCGFALTKVGYQRNDKQKKRPSIWRNDVGKAEARPVAAGAVRKPAAPIAAGDPKPASGTVRTLKNEITPAKPAKPAATQQPAAAAAQPKPTASVNEVFDGGPNADVFNKLLEKHKKLQSDMLSGRVPLSRAIIARCSAHDVCAGLGDRIFGIIVLYLGAILTDRAFFVDYSKPKPMEESLEPNRFEWRLSAIKDATVRQNMMACATGQGSLPGCNFINLLMPGAQCPHVIGSVFNDKPFVVINSDHRTECVQKLLVKIGVVPAKGQNGFAATPEAMRWWAANVSHILLNTLFRFRPEVVQAGDKMLTPPGATAPISSDCFMCVHVRSGSGVGERGRHTNFQDFASCGLTAYNERLAKASTCPKIRPWLIVGDNSAAPKQIGEYANKGRGENDKFTILDTTNLGPPTHVDQNNRATGDMVRHVFVDWYLLSRCRYFVASLSTFGGTASIFSGPRTYRYDMEVGGHSGGCSHHRISDWQRDANIPG